MKHIISITFLFYLFLSVQGQIVEGEDGLFYDYNNDLYTGIYVKDFENNSTEIEMTLKKGQKHGYTNIYFKTGTLKEKRSYKNNLMHGKWETWNDKSIKIAEANYKNGKKHGKWFIWDKNNILRYDMTYKKGKKTGTWYIYNEKGDLVSSKVYN